VTDVDLKKVTERLAGRFTDSDAKVYDAVFRSQVYGSYPAEWVRDGIMKFYERTAKPLIIDAGAHIGMATAYFEAVWPRASIVAIEPDDDNMDMMVHNVGEKTFYLQRFLVGARDNGKSFNLEQTPDGKWGGRLGSECKGAVVALSDDVPAFPVVYVEPHDRFAMTRPLSRGFLKWHVTTGIRHMFLVDDMMLSVDSSLFK
jgi:FkbM family methyltransferase